MKNFYFLPIFLLLSVTAFATDDSRVILNPVAATQIDRCLPLGSGLKALQLVTVRHKGDDESVGIIKTKGVAENIYAVGDVKHVVLDSVRTTLQKCGYALKNAEDSLQVSVIIDDFFAKSENEGVVGKDKATLSLQLILKVPGRDQTYQVEYGIEKTAKTTPFMKAKRFQKLLNATLVDVMNQVAMSQTLVDTVRAGSQKVTPVENPGVHQIFDESEIDQ